MRILDREMNRILLEQWVRRELEKQGKKVKAHANHDHKRSS